jgi:hypothetical protein
MPPVESFLRQMNETILRPTYPLFSFSILLYPDSESTAKAIAIRLACRSVLGSDS